MVVGVSVVSGGGWGSALCVNVCVWSPGRVVHGLSVALLSLLVVFCGGQRFPFMRVAWSLGGLGFLWCWRSSFCWGVFGAWSLANPFGEWSRG